MSARCSSATASCWRCRTTPGAGRGKLRRGAGAIPHGGRPDHHWGGCGRSHRHRRVIPRSPRRRCPSEARPAPTTAPRPPRWKTASERATSDDRRRESRKDLPPTGITRQLLRITTAGSVDDGKSTLIGRLLHDTDSLPLDHWRPSPTPTASPTSPRSPMVCVPNANRASPSMSHTDSFPPTPAATSSPTPRATSVTPATCLPAPPTRTWPSCWSMRGPGRCARLAGTPGSQSCWASSTLSRR